MITPPPIDPAGQVLQVVNEARAAHGLPLYVASTALAKSAADHNDRMAAGDCGGISHQCPDERALPARENARGVRWRACAENIGAASPIADNQAAIAAAATSLTESMLDERPPDDGHRANLLGRAYHRIGIAVTRAPDGTVYLTQDLAD